LNAALAVGTLKYLFGMARPTWNRTKRLEEGIQTDGGNSVGLPDDVGEEQHPAA
jgi:hypothetical protein